jgi:hypothetical protein
VDTEVKNQAIMDEVEHPGSSISAATRKFGIDPEQDVPLAQASCARGLPGRPVCAGFSVVPNWMLLCGMYLF